MILRKDMVQLIQEGKAQVQVEKTEEHNMMLDLIFKQKRGVNTCNLSKYYKGNQMNRDRVFEILPIIHASDIILDNTVIKVESEQHGKKVIAWWKEQGVDTKSNDGCLVGSFYGLRNGGFWYYDINHIEFAKIITLPEQFPEKWYMKITKENQEVANEWRRGVCGDQWVGDKNFSFLLSQHRTDNSFYYGENFIASKERRGYSDYTEITIDQFLEHVYKPFKENIKQENKMKTITWEQGQELIEMVSDSCKWKGILLDLWAVNIALKKNIDLTDELLQQGRVEASQAQKEIIDQIFGKEKEEIDLRAEKGIDGLELFKKDGGASESLISVRRGGEYENKSFFLEGRFNWEIKEDANRCLCLIPTNK